MALDKSELEKIAHLARLHITKAESEEVMLRITDILALIDEMQSINTNDVAPLAHPLTYCSGYARMRLPKGTIAMNYNR